MHPVDDDTLVLAAAIGLRVRQQRQARRWTQDQLADAAGVSRRMLINVEQGTANPSVGTLLRLSGALGVGLPAMVEPPEDQTRVKVTRHGDGVVLWTSDAGGQGVLVAGVDRPDVAELWDWVLVPGDCHTSEAHTAGTQELLQVHEGNVRVEVAGRAVILGAGDALTFPGDTAHSYANHGPTAARFTLAVFEPGVGTPARAESGHG